MLNKSDEWVFIQRPSRPTLNERQVGFWKNQLRQLLKVGIEIELNLPDRNGGCDRQNFLCQCVSIFEPKNPMPDTKNCYEQCVKWDNGNCPIAKEHGCVGIYCAAFETPCPSCSKYDRGCSSCPELYDLRKDPRYIREAIGKVLKPTRFVGSVGPSGVYKVCKDGSLLGDGGIEVATAGRRVQFFPIYDMLDNIIGLCDSYGAYVNERCSIHVHLLASYLKPDFSGNDKGKEYIKSEITEMEEPMPEIVLANFHQLVRRYHCALIWMSASGEKRKQLTRWEKFRKPILPYSALVNKMPVVVKEVGGASGSKRKYAMMNYEQMGFDQRGQVSRLHVEGRYMDGNMCPSVITSHAILMYGMMLKAVELSQFGVLKAGSSEYMNRQNEIYARLCNNDGDWGGHRHSDTERLDPHIPALVEQSRQLVLLVKSTLSEMTPADNILRSLAEKPLALRRIEGQSWKQIENDFIRKEESPDGIEQSLVRLIGLGAISECESADEWVETAAFQLANDSNKGHDESFKEALKERVRSMVSERLTQRRVYWSQDVGGYLSGS